MTGEEPARARSGERRVAPLALHTSGLAGKLREDHGYTGSVFA